MTDSKYCCTRCQRVIKTSRTESKLKEGLIVGYCYNTTHHKRIKFRIILGRGIVRTLRSDRVQTRDESGDKNFNMKGLSCICGNKNIIFHRHGSYQFGGVGNYSCHAEDHHADLQITAKLFKHEPAFDEMQEIVVKVF